MADLKNKIEKGLKSIGSNFMVLLDTHSENYFEAVMESARFMLEDNKKGVYVTVSHPCKFILNEMRERDINTGNLLFVDCITSVSGFHIAGGFEDNNCLFAKSPSELDQISRQINSLLEKIKYDEKFLIIDCISTLLIYNSASSVREFTMSLADKLRFEGADGIIVTIKKEIPDDLKENLVSICDGSVSV